MTPAQNTKLRAALSAPGPRHPILILCGDDDCRPLAEDIANAFEDTGWPVVLERPFDADPGFSCSNQAMCKIIKDATGISGHYFTPPSPGDIVLVFGVKHHSTAAP